MSNRTRWTRKWGWLRQPEWLRRLRLGAVAAVCGSSLAVAIWYGVPWSWRTVKSHPYFGIATIEVDGNRRLSRREILEWAGVHEGCSVWDAEPRTVRLRLQNHPWIEHASVQRALPRRLTIGVSERRPVAIAQLEGLKYVDRRGRILGPLRDDDSRDFPIITGLEGDAAHDFAGIALHRALQLLRWCERLRCFDAISEVHVDQVRGVTVFPLRTAVAVVLGWGGWREKLARSTRVLAAWEGQVGRLVQVDVSFRDLVVVKLRDAGHPAAVRSAKRGTRV